MSEEKMSDIPLVGGGPLESSEMRQRSEGSTQRSVNENQATGSVRGGGRVSEGYVYQDDGTRVCTGCNQNFGELQPEDDIDKIHAENNFQCELLLSRRGQKFINKHRIEKLMKEVHELNMKDLGEIKNMVGEQNELLCKAVKTIDYLEAELVRLKQELQDVRGSSRQMEELKRMNKFLSDKIKQQEDQIKALEEEGKKMEKAVLESDIEKRALCMQVTVLSEEKDRIVDVLKWQAGEMEKKIKECQELQKKLQQNRDLVPEEAQEACIFMGYTREEVQYAVGIYTERHRAGARKIMEILLEKEENRQCSEQGGRGQLVVGGNHLYEKKSPFPGSKFPEYALLSARVGSFRGWRNTCQSPKAIADAGMFFTGQGDGTKCFHCGIGLMNWESFDEPWFKHARWSPDCDFVRQWKGQDFINNVQAHVNQQNETEEVNNSNTEQQVTIDDVAQALPGNGNGTPGNSENPEDFDGGSEKKMDE